MTGTGQPNGLLHQAFRQFQYPTVPLHVASPLTQDAANRMGKALFGTATRTATRNEERSPPGKRCGPTSMKKPQARVGGLGLSRESRPSESNR